MALMDTSLMSPKCSSQNRLESTCSSLLLVRVLYVCSCVACTSESRCLRSSSSVRSRSSSTLTASLPVDVTERQMQTLDPPCLVAPSFTIRSIRSSSSSMQLWMFSKMVRVRLSSTLQPSTMPSIWSTSRTHRRHVLGSCSAASTRALTSLTRLWMA